MGIPFFIGKCWPIRMFNGCIIFTSTVSVPFQMGVQFRWFPMRIVVVIPYCVTYRPWSTKQQAKLPVFSAVSLHIFKVLHIGWGILSYLKVNFSKNNVKFFMRSFNHGGVVGEIEVLKSEVQKESQSFPGSTGDIQWPSGDKLCIPDHFILPLCQSFAPQIVSHAETKK